MNKYKNEGKFSHNNIHDTASELFKEWELGQEEEFTLLEIILKSGKNRIQYRLYDQYDKKTNSSSMSRTTGFTATATTIYY